MINKFLYSYLVLILLLSICFSCNKNRESEDSIVDTDVINNETIIDKDERNNQSRKSLSDKNTEFDFLPSSTTNQVVKHTYYTLSYNEKFEQAEWVAYELKKSYIKNNNFKRPFFIEDPKVTTGSADW